MSHGCWHGGMIPEMVERHWFLQFLHNQRGSVLKALLYLKGNQRIIVINAPGACQRP